MEDVEKCMDHFEQFNGAFSMGECWVCLNMVFTFSDVYYSYWNKV
jgi:hypothetical protein